MVVVSPGSKVEVVGLPSAVFAAANVAFVAVMEGYVCCPVQCLWVAAWPVRLKRRECPVAVPHL